MSTEPMSDPVAPKLVAVPDDDAPVRLSEYRRVAQEAMGKMFGKNAVSDPDELRSWVLGMSATVLLLCDIIHPEGCHPDDAPMRVSVVGTEEVTRNPLIRIERNATATPGLNR